MKAHIYLVVSLAVLAFATPGVAEESVAKAKELWERYVALETRI